MFSVLQSTIARGLLNPEMLQSSKWHVSSKFCVKCCAFSIVNSDLSSLLTLEFAILEDIPTVPYFPVF